MSTDHVAQNPDVLCSLLNDLPPSLHSFWCSLGSNDLPQRELSPPEDAAWSLPRPGQPVWGQIRSASHQPCDSGAPSPAAAPGLGWPRPQPPAQTPRDVSSMPAAAAASFLLLSVSLNDDPNCLLKRHIKDSCHHDATGLLTVC